MIQRLLGAALLAGLLCLPAYGQDEPPEQSASAEAAAEEAPAAAERTTPPELPLATIPLQENLRFTVRPTILGLIPPDSAEDYGEGLIRVSGLDGRRVELHYEIKEEIEKERGGDELFELQEAPVELRTEFLTRIRRGDIVVSDITQGRRIACPLFWETGDIQARDYGLLWIAPPLLSALKQSGGCDWELQCAADPDAQIGQDLDQLIESRRRGSGLPEDAQPRLELIEEHGRYLVPVNGAMSQLEAVHVRDSYGMAEYWFLDDPDNPLLLKMSFIAIPEASPSEGGIARQLQAGIGFAVTSINF